MARIKRSHTRLKPRYKKKRQHKQRKHLLQQLMLRRSLFVGDRVMICRLVALGLTAALLSGVDASLRLGDEGIFAAVLAFIFFMGAGYPSYKLSLRPRLHWSLVLNTNRHGHYTGSHNQSSGGGGGGAYESYFPDRHSQDAVEQIWARYGLDEETFFQKRS